MIFDSWSVIGRTLVFGLTAYVALVFFLRISGKRTLSRMDPFDFVITTALGSVLANVLVSKNIALTTGLSAFAILIGLQFIVTWLSVHSGLVRAMIKSEPALLYYRGSYMREAMKREHVAEIEILAAVRERGMAAMEDVEAVVLEADSGFSVVSRSKERSTSALADVSSVIEAT